jgi:Ca2+-transporting ATPase
MMGHVWHHDGEILIAAKGSPEKILTICVLSDGERKQAENKILEMSSQGLRVIAVGIMKPADKNRIPAAITDCRLTLCGLVGLADPPRESVKEDIRRCTKAGIRVVMITGDNGITASSIAKQIGMPNCDQIITGDELNGMSDEELCRRVRGVSIFSRVIPEHKMRIVKALKNDGEIVAMTGDGVNDAPALKYADIGIAMGKRGSEVSREASDLILMDDNFSTIVDTVRDGRRIYDNIRKAVGYVFTIHIPIAFSALLAPFLRISPADLFLLPLHVVLLELIIDPTCSIVLERQPAERNIMERKPRDLNEKILTPGILLKSVLQGLVIFAASFGTYFTFLQQNPGNAPLARTMGLSIVMLANLFLVLVNSSNYDFVFQSVRHLAQDRVMWAILIGTIAGLFLILYTPLNGILKLAPLTIGQFFLAIGISAVSVLWYEIVKFSNHVTGPHMKGSRKR